jgi:hypothetical protein
VAIDTITKAPTAADTFEVHTPPTGAWKDSGIGFRHGEYGIKKFVRPESLVITRFGQKREPLYFPYTDERRQKLRKITRLLTARDWRRRLGRD